MKDKKGKYSIGPLAKALKQRDELLEALKLAVNYLEDGAGNTSLTVMQQAIKNCES